MQKINSDTVAHPLARYRNHLEFNGYHIEEDDDLLVCRHSRKRDLMLRNVPGRGVLISTAYGFKANVKRMHLLEYVNELNAEFMFMKAYIDDSDLMMETFLEGDYDRTNLSILLDNIEYDMAIFDDKESTQEYVQ